jgi:hypothetical protein
LKGSDSLSTQRTTILSDQAVVAQRCNASVSRQIRPLCAIGIPSPAAIKPPGHQRGMRGSGTLLSILGHLCSSLVLVDEAAEDGPALDLLLGEVSDRVVGSGRPELAAAMGAASVVVGRVVGQD